MKDMVCADAANKPVTREFDSSAASIISRAFGLSDAAARIISARGIYNIKDAGAFLYPRLSLMHSPFMFNNMNDAVSLIRSAIEKHVKVALFSDSDIDGLTSLAILKNFLESAGVEVFTRYPVDDETYGMSSDIVEEVKDSGAGLLITLDCGVRDVTEIGLIRSYNIDCIVCDHHEQGQELPDAVVIDQKIRDSSYPFRDLAGVGVALKLCHAVLFSYLPGFNRRYALYCRDEKSDTLSLSVITNGVVEKEFSRSDFAALSDELPEINTVFYYNISAESFDSVKSTASFVPFEELLVQNGFVPMPGINHTLTRYLELPDEYPLSTAELMHEIFFDISFIRPGKINTYLSRWLPLAAVGTVADIVTALGENRIIISKGLELFSSCDIPAFAVLAEEFKEPDAKAVAWRIAPLLNAPGRLGKTEMTAEFLTSTDPDECRELVGMMRKLNDERRRSVKDCTDLFTDEISEGAHSTAKNFTYILSDRVSDGFTGLIANKVAEMTGRPAIIVSGDSSRELFKGSGRAPDGIDFLSYVEPHSSLFERFGGHSAAFGFSVSRDKISEIIAKIDEEMSRQGIRISKKSVDLEVEKPSDLVRFFKSDYKRLKPFASGNEEPVFFSGSVGIESFTAFGSNSKHGRYCLDGGIFAIGWNMTEEMKSAAQESRAAFSYRLEDDPYTRKMRLVIESILR